MLREKRTVKPEEVIYEGFGGGYCVEAGPGVGCAPSPLEVKDLREWAAGWADQLLAIETGEVRGVAASI
jgi:hypothetical protein